VVLLTATGYTSEQWKAAREASPGRILALDQAPWTGYALEEASSLADAVATGIGESDIQSSSPRLYAEMRKTGRTLAVVSGGSLQGSVGASLCVSSGALDGPGAGGELARSGVGVVLSRSILPSDGLTEAGYAVHANAADLILHGSLPAAATIPPSELSFDALVFQALHLAAKNVKGFALAVDADPETVSAAEFCGALSSVLAYARKEGRTLVVVLLSQPNSPAATFAVGPGAEKFAGTMRLTDVPKVIAGMAHVPFRRDFSAAYLSRRGMLAR
jgi:hypothetical protein